MIKFFLKGIIFIMGVQSFIGNLQKNRIIEGLPDSQQCPLNPEPREVLQHNDMAPSNTMRDPGKDS